MGEEVGFTGAFKVESSFLELGAAGSVTWMVFEGDDVGSNFGEKSMTVRFLDIWSIRRQWSARALFQTQVIDFPLISVNTCPQPIETP